MQVRAGAAARRTAQTDDLSCLDPFAALHEPFGEVSVVGFQTIVVTHDDQVAVTAPVVLRDADPAVESRINGIARFNRNIDSLMSPAMADAVFGADAALVGIMIALERIHQIDRKRRRLLLRNNS